MAHNVDLHCAFFLDFYVNLNKIAMDNISTIILAASLFIIMLGMGLSLVTADFKRIITYPKAVAVGLFNQLILLPVIAFVIVSVFPTKPEIAIGIMILAACPGGATSNLIAHLAKGDTALSVSLTAMSSFITLLTIPFIVNFSLSYFAVTGQNVQLDVIKTIIQILVIVVIPIVIGMFIRKTNEGFALKMEKPVKISFRCSFSFSDYRFNCKRKVKYCFLLPTSRCYRIIA